MPLLLLAPASPRRLLIVPPVLAVLLAGAWAVTWYVANDNDHAPTPIDGTWAVVSGATEAQPWRQVFFEYNRAHLAVVRDVNRRDRMHHFEADEARVVRVWNRGCGRAT